MKMEKDMAVILATGGFVGLLPFAPGTFGTLWGIPLAWGLSYLDSALAAFFLVFFVLLAIWAADRAEAVMGKKDPGAVVIDEMAGYMVTLFALPFNATSVVAGFLFFRLFDIAKPWPVRNLDKNIHGGLGIVADDLMAGLYAHVLLRVFLHFFPG